MATGIGINGFGRIGRLTFRNIMERHGQELEILGINDLTDPETNAHLLQWDSTYRKYPGNVEAGKDFIKVDGKAVRVTAEKDPVKIPWKQWGADIVIESTGIFTDANKAKAHRDSGARKVIISAPAKNEDFTIILGVNESEYDKSRHNIISNGSCTTNCIVPVAKVLNDSLGIVRGLMTTVHSYTNSQRLLDQFHKDLRRARSAAVNIIPTTTGAAKLIGNLIKDLEGVTDGIAMRVPTQDGSICDFVADLKKDVTVDEVNQAFKSAADGAMKGIIEYSEVPLVSTDVIGNTHSAVFDSQGTIVIGGSMVKVLAWYDNEWGYSSRLADVTAMVAEKGW